MLISRGPFRNWGEGTACLGRLIPLRKTFAALALATLTILAVPAAAYADDSYTPTKPTEPSLSGSTAAGFCNNDAPYIRFSVTLNDPDNVATSHDAKLVLSGSGQSTTIPLGTLVGNKLSGSVLWPGASVDANGAPTGWPGWEKQGGQWVEIPGNYRWTRGDITATIEVNPSVTVPLSYPPQSPTCQTDPPVTGAAASTGQALPATGMSAAVLPIAVVGILLALLGVVLLVSRRLARR